MSANMKERLKSQLAPRVAAITVAGIEGTLHMRPLTGDGRDWLDGRMQSARNNAALFVGIRREVIGRCLCHQDGTPLFQPNEYADIGNADGVIVDELFQHAQRVSGLVSEDNRAIEEAAKN